VGRDVSPAERAAHAVAHQMGSGVYHSANGWRVRCPVHGGQDRNLSIKDGSGADIIVRCFSHGCDPVAILRAIGAVGGREPDQWRGRRSDPPPIKATDSSKLDYLLSKLLPIEGTVVQTYLHSRGLDLPPDGHHLRFLPANPPKYPWPCMVSIITDFLDVGRVMSLHLTRLRADGQGKAPLPKHEQRSFLAGLPIKSGIIRLCDDGNVTRRLGLAEGVETALSVMTSYCRDEGRLEPVWSALDAGNLGTLPILGGIETLAIYVDKGEVGEKAADRLADRWLAADREVFTFTAPVDDWNPKVAT
jgi:hypothetical protein